MTTDYYFVRIVVCEVLTGPKFFRIISYFFTTVFTKPINCTFSKLMCLFLRLFFTKKCVKLVLWFWYIIVSRTWGLFVLFNISKFQKSINYIFPLPFFSWLHKWRAISFMYKHFLFSYISTYSISIRSWIFLHFKKVS